MQRGHISVLVLVLMVLGPALTVLADEDRTLPSVDTYSPVASLSPLTGLVDGSVPSDTHAMPVSSLGLGPKRAYDEAPAYLSSPPAAGRAGPDVTPMNISFNSSDLAWFGYSVATVGVPTEVTAHISNIGTTNATNVGVKIEIKDNFGIVINSNTTTLVDIPPGESSPVIWPDWTPTVSQKIYATITATLTGDADLSNNVWTFAGSGWWVDKWLELANSDADWTGNKASTEWHVTTTVSADPDPTDHSSPNAFFAGTETPLSDFYTPGMNVSLVSKSIDLKRMNPSYPAFMNFKYYGAASLGDNLRVFVSMDDGVTWVDTSIVISGVTTFQGGQRWLYRVDNWADFNKNGNLDDGEYDHGIDISEYIGHDVKFKFTFRSGPTSTGLGYYLDDFIVYGYESEHEVAVLDIDDLGTTHTNETEPIVANIINLGTGSSPAMTARLRVHNSTGSLVDQQDLSVPPVAALSSFKASWDYTFANEGDFWLVIEILSLPYGSDGSTLNNWKGRRVHVSSGAVGVLFVDDDGGATNNGRMHLWNYDTDTDWLLVKALEANKIQFDVTHVLFSSSGPDLDVLRNYHTVIWSTGWDGMGRSLYGTLTAADRTALTDYMYSGGSLWLMSQETVFDLSLGTSSFMSSMLHVTSGGDDAGFPVILDTVAGNPVLGTTSYEGQIPIPGNDRTDSLSPDNLAHGLSYQSEGVQSPSTGPFNGIYYNGTNKLVYNAFDISYLKKDSDRTAMTGAVMKWLFSGLSLSVTEPSKYVDAGGTVNYTFTILNQGIANKTIHDIAVTGVTNGWTASVSPAVSASSPKTELQGFQSMTGTLRIDAPDDVPPESIGRATVMVVIKETGEVLENMTSSIVKMTPRMHVSVSPKDQTGQAGMNSSYLVTVINTGNIKATVNLSLDGTFKQWGTFESAYMSLSPGEDDGVVLEISVPSDAAAGNYSFDVTAEGRYQSIVMTAVDRINLTVRVFRSLEVSSVRAPEGGRVDPNDGPTTVFVEVTNKGNGPDKVTVMLSGTFLDQENWGWDTETVTIPSFAKDFKVNLNLTVWDKAEGMTYNVTVSAISQDAKTIAYGYIHITVLRPDLYLTQDGIMLDYDLVVGEETSFNVKVFNSGSVDSPAPNLTIYDRNNEKVFTGKASSSIKAGGFSEVAVKWTPVYKGSEELTFVVNDGKGIIESAYDNDSITKSVTVLQPNLKLEELDILFYVAGVEKNKVTVGELVSITVQVRNMDAYSYKANDVTVEFFVDGKKIDNKTISVVPASNSPLFIRTEWKAAKGTHTVLVRVDPMNKVNEQSEKDNEATRQLIVKPKAAAPFTASPLMIAVAVVVGVILLVGYGLVRGVIPSPVRMSKVEIAQKNFTCNECKKSIKKGTKSYHCSCGRRSHVKCAKRAELCECLRRVRLDQ